MAKGKCSLTPFGVSRASMFFRNRVVKKGKLQNGYNQSIVQTNTTFLQNLGRFAFNFLRFLKTFSSSPLKSVRVAILSVSSVRCCTAKHLKMCTTLQYKLEVWWVYVLLLNTLKKLRSGQQRAANYHHGSTALRQN